MAPLRKSPYYIKHAASRILHKYADMRVGASNEEKRCYKQTDTILLTFDDYGTAEEVEEILDILHIKQVRAMFFLQGDWAEIHPELVEKIRLHNHLIGNHTVTHKDMVDEKASTVWQEIANGLPGPWFRPPYGRYNASVRRIARSLGYAICYWSIDSRDWTGATEDEMRHTIMTELHPGAVILFHIHGMHTRALLPNLIDDIRDNGYFLTDFDENWLP